MNLISSEEKINKSLLHLFLYPFIFFTRSSSLFISFTVLLFSYLAHLFQPPYIQVTINHRMVESENKLPSFLYPKLRFKTGNWKLWDFFTGSLFQLVGSLFSANSLTNLDVPVRKSTENRYARTNSRFPSQGANYVTMFR